MSGQNSDYSKYIIPAAVVVGGYLIIRPILEKLGILENAATKQRELENKAAVDSTFREILARQKPTISEANVKFYADTIYASLRYSLFDDDYEKAGLYLSYPKNDADVVRLIQLFGEREECYAGVFCYFRTLPQMVSSNLSQEKINAINDNYYRKGITFRW